MIQEEDIDLLCQRVLTKFNCDGKSESLTQRAELCTYSGCTSKVAKFRRINQRESILAFDKHLQ